jgi:hypothetical protein
MALSQHIKPSPYRPPSRAQIERARSMYAEGFTVSRILAACDMSLGTLNYWLGGGPRDAGGATLYPPIARRRVVEGKRRKPLASDRDSLVATLWRTAERTARDLGERLARPGASTPERERDVRMFGMTVRALRELSLFDAGGPAASAVDEPPADIDEFRRELARRIHALIDAEQAGQGQAADQRASIAKS